MNCVYEPETIKKNPKRQKTKRNKKNEHTAKWVSKTKNASYEEVHVQAIALTLHTHIQTNFFENVSYAFNENWKGKTTNKSKNQNKEEQKIHQRISSEQWRSLSQPERAHYAPKLIQMARTEGECERRTRKKGLD